MSAGNWTPSPLVVDGWREGVRLVAELPGAWTTVGERYLLHVLACDAFERESAPGLDNLSAWTGINRRSVQKLLDGLTKKNERRPALLLRANAQKGRVTAKYRLVFPLTPEVQPPPTVQKVAYMTPLNMPTAEVNIRSTSAQPSALDAPPFPSPRDSSLSSEQILIASLLGLSNDDEKLQSVSKMIPAHIKTRSGWLRACHANGDLLRLLDEAHTDFTHKQIRAAEADRNRCPHGVVNGITHGQCQEPACEVLYA
jgi:hypothetical protein